MSVANCSPPSSRSSVSSLSSVDEPPTPELPAAPLMAAESTPTPPAASPRVKEEALTRSKSLPPKRFRHKHSSSLDLDNPRPRYIRTQPVGLISSSPEPKRSFLPPSVPPSPLEHSPIFNRGCTARSREGEEEDLTPPRLERPLKHRSDSLPAFPPNDGSPTKSKMARSTKVEDLPVRPAFSGRVTVGFN
jgi:hypothetical protein